MKTIRQWLAVAALGVVLGSWQLAGAQEAAPASQPMDQPASAAVESDVEVEKDNDADEHSRHDRVIFAIDRDARLDAGDHADAVVAIAGSAIAAGEVGEAVVAIFGNAHTTARVGNAVVALFGDADVAGEVRRDVV